MPLKLDLHYKAHPFSDHVAKFYGNRSRDPRERVAKEINKKKERKHHVPNGLIMEVLTINGRGEIRDGRQLSNLILAHSIRASSGIEL